MFQTVQLLVYDFDGVLTDNTAYVDQEGREMVRVHRGDGFAIALFKKAGYKQLILSTERNPVVTKRAEKLDIPVIQACTNKKEALAAYCQQQKVLLKNVLYVGNDLNDLEVMHSVGIKVCPSDAVSGIKSLCDVIISAEGGTGVIRELYEIYQQSSK
jgi:3-deoxy-D-manno-octulosonate 8-phosphate phosphatase (KDO 8-P phosphatase)